MFDVFPVPEFGCPAPCFELACKMAWTAIGREESDLLEPHLECRTLTEGVTLASENGLERSYYVIGWKVRRPICVGLARPNPGIVESQSPRPRSCTRRFRGS